MQLRRDHAEIEEIELITKVCWQSPAATTNHSPRRRRATQFVMARRSRLLWQMAGSRGRGFSWFKALKRFIIKIVQ